MIATLFVICLYCGTLSAREYGLLFQNEKSYLQTDYSTLCDNSALRFEVLINRTSGVLLLAENKVRMVKLLLYFERPGVYVNVTDGMMKYNLPLTLDFFSSLWFGWHDVELRLTEQKIYLVFDNTERQALLEGRHFFPEEMVEDNEIYLGAGPNWISIGNLTRFSGWIKNVKQKSCGCEHWKPIKIIKNVDVSTETQGECTSQDSCQRQCVCYLFPWGGKRCECPEDQCPQTSNYVVFKFDKPNSKSGRLQEFGNYNWISSLNGPFGYGFEVTAQNSLILFVAKGRTCFRNIFLCENGFSYNFWVLPSMKSRLAESAVIVKHSSSLAALCGVSISRCDQYINVTITTPEGTTSSVSSKLTLSVWSLVTIIFNQTHLHLYIDSYLKQYSNKFIKVHKMLSDLSSTRLLFVGDSKDSPDLFIENFQFSTNITDVGSSAIQEFRVEHYSDYWKTNLKCSTFIEQKFLNFKDCYKVCFTAPKVTRFYISIIISVTDRSQGIVLQTPFISVTLISSKVLLVQFPGLSSHYVTLIENPSRLFYIEMSMDDKGEVIILQNLDILLLTIVVDIDSSVYPSRKSDFLVNNELHLLKTLRIINADRVSSARSLRILTKDIKHYSVGFERNETDRYDGLQLTKGYLDQGLSLKYPSLYVSQDWFKGSCIRYLDSCYHGITISFWLKVINGFQNINENLFRIFSSGPKGITLLLEKESFSFLLIIESRRSISKFVFSSTVLTLNQWHFLEISFSQNGIISLYLNRNEAQRIYYFIYIVPSKCNNICIGDDTSQDNVDIVIDELRVWDVDRQFLYANQYISAGPSEHKLISFTNYQLNKSFVMKGPAKIISTKHGYALALNDFGSRFAIVNLTDGPRCFWNLDSCRRGITIRLWLRPDNLALSKQTILATSFVFVRINLENIVIQIRALGKSWHILSKDILQLFIWKLIEISWNGEDGLKVYVNERLSGHDKVGRTDSVPKSRVSPSMSLGIDYRTTANMNYATVVIDDVELFEADQSNLAHETYLVDDLSCVLHFNFDSNSISTVTRVLGIVGSAGLFQSNSSLHIPIPKCFTFVISGCHLCFTLRFWIKIQKLNTVILEGGYFKMSVMSKEITVVVSNVILDKSYVFSCEYGEYDLLNKWHFIEVSWHSDEGVLVFLNRDGLSCIVTSEITTTKSFLDVIEISKDFIGVLDEIEMYHARISILYWKKVLEENSILLILEKIKERERIHKEVALLKEALKSSKKNPTVEVVDSFQFNGSNYVSYKLPKAIYPYIPGGREEVEISFMCFNNIQSSIIWISDSKLSKNTLTLKNKKLYFTKFYILPASNTSKRLTEELEIHSNILPNVVYNVAIYQRSGEIVMKTKSLNESNTQSMIGRDPLLPMDSNVYIGGYNNDKYLESNQINSHLFGIIYKARLKPADNEKVVDIIQEMAEAKSNYNIVNHGDVKVIKKNVIPKISQKTSFLAELSSTGVPLMINSPFFSMTLPKWDFNMLTSIEIEFNTYESTGLILFIGNISDFVALEIYDSKLIFIYKCSNSLRRVKIIGDLVTISDFKPYKVYLGRDLSGNIKIYFNRDEVIEDPMKIFEFNNSVSLVGHLGPYNLWPPEILSRTSFLGCINFIKINDADYINFLRNSSFITYRIHNFYQGLYEIIDTFTRGSCETPFINTCQDSSCRGGWCQLTGNSFLGQLSNNFRCNCLFSSKTLSTPFTNSSVANNMDIWTYEFLRQSRSKPCLEDAKQIVIVDQSSLFVNFQKTFPFVSTIDLEFLILVKSKRNCVMELFFQQKSMSILIIEGQFIINIGERNIVSIADVNLGDDQWHGVQILGRLQSIIVKIGHLQKEFSSSLIPTFTVSSIKVGNCAGYQNSHFKFKGLTYNKLSLINPIPVSEEKMFFNSQYNYPAIKESPSFERSSINHFLLTFLNNFQYAVTTKPITLSWFTQIKMSFSTNHPGVVFYIKNGPKFLVCIRCRNNNLLFLHFDNSLRNRVEKIEFTDERIDFVLTMDLIRELIKLKGSNNILEKNLLLGIESWNVGDIVHVQFGVDVSNNAKINVQDLEKDHQTCVEENLPNPIIGCLQSFLWSNGNSTLNFNSDWNNAWETSPPTSIYLGQCKAVEKCLPQSCANGKCRSIDHIKTYCDCSFTDFTGERCHEVKDKCASIQCLNSGKCVSTKDYRGMDLTYCNCSGTEFSGKHCEELICLKDFCLNNGICYTTSSSRLCDCKLTKFSGPKCETPVCESTTCGDRGRCQIISRFKAPICHCNPGFFGDYCDIKTAGKCETICKNNGICSSYHPIFKLCSNQYCQKSDNFTCDCDHTMYTGSMCELAEIGFLPEKDGVVVMEAIPLLKTNYLRILFESPGQIMEATLLTIMKKPREYLKILLVNETLKIAIKKLNTSNWSMWNIGKISKKNVLILMEEISKIDFYLNNKIESLFYSNLSLENKERFKRDTSLEESYYPAIIIGCNEKMSNCFNGLIGGVRWNGHLLRDKRNRIFKGGSFLSIDKLQARPFPTPAPFIMLIETKGMEVVSIALAVFMVILLFALGIFKKLWPRHSKITKVHLNNNTCPTPEIPLLEIQEPVQEKMNFSFPHSSPDISYEANDEPKLTVKPISNSEASLFECRILVINDIDSVHALTVVDCAYVPNNTLVIVTNYLPEIKIFQSIFPTDFTDKLYKCNNVYVSPRGHYIYCHMTSLLTFNADTFEIQAWKVANPYKLLAKPPNLLFTNSMAFGDESYKIILLNNISLQVTLFNLKSSEILWTGTMAHYTPILIEPLLVLSTTMKLIINKEVYFEVFDMNAQRTSIKHDPPLYAKCTQIVDADDNRIIILTDNNDLYHWDIDSGYYDHKQLPGRVTVITKSLRTSKNSIALGVDTGEVYLSTDDDGESYVILGPKNERNILCLKFSSDGEMLAAAYDNNLIHVWKIISGPGLCHFHAVHDRGVLYDMNFTDNNRKMAVEVLSKKVSKRTQKKLSIINITSN